MTVRIVSWLRFVDRGVWTNGEGPRTTDHGQEHGERRGIKILKGGGFLF